MMNRRLESIKQYIAQHREVKLSQLEELLPDVSSMTLRRDLAQLERQGYVVRFRGGARAVDALSVKQMREDIYTKRERENRDGKLFIAGKAVPLLEEGRSVYIDAGSTGMYFASQIPNQKLSVLTNAPNIAMELSKHDKIEILLIGGYLSQNMAISGANAMDFIKNINVDIAFMTTAGFSLDTGFTNGSADECHIKRAIIRKSRKKVMLMDHSKLDKCMMFTFAGLKDIDVLVCDHPLPEPIRQQAEEHHIKIL